MLIKTGSRAMVDEWRGYLAEFRPGLRTAAHDDPTVDPEDAAYALCWEPPRGWLATLPNLRAIFSIGAGVDHVTADPTWPRHVPLVRMGGEETAQRMGEYVAWACLSLLRNARTFALAQPAGRWAYEPGEHTARERTVGILGMGTLGAACVPMLRALGFAVRGWTRTPREVAGAEVFAGREALGAFLEEAHILVCLLPATPETEGIVDAALLAQLPRGAGIVNAARGTHVVLPDLIAALDSGQLCGAVLDAFEMEPLPPEDPAWTHPKITVTPHVASIARRRERARFVADAIAGFEAGGALPNLYDPVRGY
jgi:glyoxylate/hydroxypyruvate reductase A